MFFCVRLVSFLEAKAESLHRGAHHYTGVSPSFLGGRDLTSSSALSCWCGISRNVLYHEACDRICVFRASDVEFFFTGFPKYLI